MNPGKTAVAWCHRPSSELDPSISNMKCGLLIELVFSLQNFNLCSGFVSVGETAFCRGGQGEAGRHLQGQEGRAELRRENRSPACLP